MPHRRDLATQTIIALAAALRGHWASVPAEAQDAIRRIIAEMGPEIYSESAINRAGRMVALLDAIASLSGLPGPALDALSAGAGVSGGLVRISDAQRDQGLDALRQVCDARRYSDPRGLADSLRRKIAQSWRGLDEAARARWEELDRVYSAGGDPVEYLDAIDALLGDRLPFAREAIEAGKTWSDAIYRTAARPKSPLPDELPTEVAPPPPTSPGAALEESGPPLGAAPEPPARVRRFANVYFPALVHSAQQLVPLIVHVAQKAAAGTVTVREGSAQVTLTVGDLAIFVHAEDFEVQYGLGGAELPAVPFGASVAVRPTGDSEPVIFFLTPKAPGAKKISVEFYQNRRSVGSLAFGVSVVAEFASGVEASRANIKPVALLSADAATARPPDLNLRVMQLGDGLSYSFVLTSADGRYDQQPLGRVTLRSDPRGYFKSVTDELSSLARISADERTAVETAAGAQRLRELGARLWDELFPAEFKREYRLGNLDAYKGKGFVITSDEPWIPWEIARPFELERGRALYSDPPLCELFRLTRWLSGSGAPDRLTVTRGVVVAPQDNLQFAQEEIDFFKQVDQRSGAGEWAVPILSLDEVSREMEAGQAQVFHFSCHGNFQYDDPEESLLKLGDAFLRPSNIRFSDRLALWQSAPLVFLNACHSGRAGFTLTRMGGWAESFIGAGASAFIGSLWEINDKLAARFAREFYNRLWGLDGHASQTIGEAFHQARMVIKAEDEANPTWLAYALYGDPNGRVSFGS